jgi:hypothetical protein
MVKLKNIVDFITNNQLEEFDAEYGFNNLIVCFVPVKGYDFNKVYLDYTINIETGEAKIEYCDCRDEDDDKHEFTIINTEEALKLRGLA